MQSPVFSAFGKVTLISVKPLAMLRCELRTNQTGRRPQLTPNDFILGTLHKRADDLQSIQTTRHVLLLSPTIYITLAGYQ